MGFDVAILCDINDEHKYSMINRVKAAYLYADNVTVYDLHINEPCFNHALKAYQKFFCDSSYNDITKKAFAALFYDSENAQELIFEDYRSLQKTEKSDIEALMQYLGYLRFLGGLLAQSEAEEYQPASKDYFDIIKQIRKMDLNYRDTFERMGIKQIGYTSNHSPDSFDFGKVWVNLHTQFIKDKGFKLLNDDTPVPDETGSLTTIFPAMLSDFSISKLPGFEAATVDEIIDIRRELDKYIIPYRAAVLRMAQDIKGMPDTDSYQRECMTIYLREIEPQVAAINAAIHDNNVLKNIAKKVVTNKETWASVGALVTAFATTGDIANAVSIGAATAFAGLSIMEGIVSTLEEKKKIKDNEMFFLYEAGQRLKK